MIIYTVLFFVVMIFSLSDSLKKNQRNYILGFLVFGVIIFVAFRGEVGGDGLNYLQSWSATPVITDDNLEKPSGLAYSEPTFYWFTLILKSIWDNPIFYFGVMAFLGLFFISKSLKSYAIYPMMGLLVYMSRFFILRDFNQIRAAAAIAIIVYATKYIAQKDFKHFFLYWIGALCFHMSMIIVLPFYFINKINFSTKKLYLILAGVFLSAFVINKVFEQILSQISNTFGILTAYTGDSEMAKGSGMLNPMIMFQLFFCLLFIAAEPYLKDKQPYYYTIRNGYVYSTIILMFFSSLLVIGARLSTIFATYEIFILPAFVSIFNSKSRVYVVILLYLLLTFFYFHNLGRAGDLNNYGDFTI